MNFQILFIFFLSLTSSDLLSQTQTDYYISYSENNGLKNTLKFENDNTIALKKLITHSGSEYKIRGNYIVKQDSIIIEFTEFESNFEIEIDSINRGLNIISKLILIKKNAELIDYETKTVYVTSRISEKAKIDRRGLAIIDGNRFEFRKQSSTLNKFIDFIFGKNRRLKKALEPFAKDYKNYESKTINGLSAYLNYGINGLGGVIIIQQKE